MAKSYYKQLRITMSVIGNIAIREDYLRSTPESKGSRIKQTEWDCYFNWYADTSESLQRFQNNFIKRFITES